MKTGYAWSFCVFVRKFVEMKLYNQIQDIAIALFTVNIIYNNLYVQTPHKHGNQGKELP